ncbi:60S ribosomal protein L16A [Mucor velutinosus]|uniref:60S ribosomal protein L16A n=1 Tax=Mucor velutinosus TaxID=708070 RepID=A0AAN7HZZ0_9FUNG|nr:60S ribosomal protein L16A [Mucor velutinosus]
MSFLSEFNQNIFEPWRTEYVAYESISNGLNEICSSGHWTRQDEEDFESAIRLEAGKVDLFIIRKQREIESRLRYCQRILSQQKDINERTRHSADDTLTDILADINDLTKFTRLNFKALEALIQQHDRLTSTNRRPLLVEVCRTRPLDSQRFDGILVQVSSLLDTCRGRLDQGDSSVATEPNRQDYINARYWIHQDNVTEVKAILLFNLPIFGNDSYEQSERAMSYIYLDNDSFDEYTAQLQSDDGAELLTCRWNGDIQSASQVFVERHVFVKGGFSTQDGIAIDKNQLYDFILTQNYSAEAYAQDLKNVGFDQNYVELSYTIAKNIQSSIIDKRLEPKLQIHFNRLLFEAPHDKTLSVSLDNNVTLNVTSNKFSMEWLHSNDAITDKRHVFPHAILETRMLDKAPPQWLSRLLESRLVYEVPRFSICLHGVALFWSPQLPLLPWWLSQIDIDIRAAKRNDKLLVEGASEYSGLTRSRSLKLLIDGQYRVGYLEAQLQKGNPQRRHANSRHNSYSSSVRHESIVITDESLNQAVLDAKDKQEYVVQLEDASASKLTLYSMPTGNDDETQCLRSRSSISSQQQQKQQRQKQRFNDFYRPEEGGSQAYMLQDPHTIKENDDMRIAVLAELGQEKEEKKKKKKKKKKKLKPPQHTMEPKLFFANERTFINWLQFSALIMTAALTLLNFGDHVSTIAGATFFGISMVIALYAFFRYRWRAHQMSTRPDIRYDDLYGPVGLCCLLLSAMVLNFVLRWQHPSSSDTYLGINNKTNEQQSNTNSTA